ncbi:MAG: hypothetical protein AAGD43_22225 [Pseudomonadota bacterium]
MNYGSCAALEAEEMYGMSRGLVLRPNNAKSADELARLGTVLINEDRLEI